MNDTQTIINILNKLKNKYNDKPPLLQFFLELGMNKHSNISCIAFYKRFILENTDTDFTLEDIKRIEELYIISKNYLNKLNRFAYNFKIRKAIKYNDEDLFFNKISDYKKKHIVNIYSNKTIYSFRISDLINLWNDCLTKSENLFCKSSELKNPYTNIEFSKTNLYNIFFSIKDSEYMIPSWILLFFHENFDLTNFTYKYYSILKDVCIMSFINEGALYEKIENIDNMLHEYRKECNYYSLKERLDNYYKFRITQILKSPLKMYLFSTLSCNPLVKNRNKMKLKSWLNEYFNDKDNDDLKIYFKSESRLYRTPITINPLTRRILRRASQISVDYSSNDLITIRSDGDDTNTYNTRTISDISFINPFIPSHTIPRSPTRNTIIRNITNNQPPLLPPPPPPHFQNRYVNVPLTPIPPPPINDEINTNNVFLPEINNNLDSENDVIMTPVESNNTSRLLGRTRRRRRRNNSMLIRRVNNN